MDDWLIVWNTVTFLFAVWAMSDAGTAKRKVKELEAKFKEFSERKPEPAKAR